MTKDEVASRVREFVDENFLYMRPEFELDNADSLMGRGIVDSMGVVEMLEFLEEQFGVGVPNEDLTEANLGTIDAIAAYVAGRASQVEQPKA